MPGVATGVLRSAYSSLGFRCGQIATRHNHYGQGNTPYSSNGSDRSATFREKHVAIKATSGVRLVYVNWNYNDMATAGGACTLGVRASIEYPAGTFYPASWGGLGEVLMQPQRIASSDPIMVSIPQGATFYTRTYVRATVAAGRWPLGILQTQTSDGEGNNRSASLAPEQDLTTSGVVPAVHEEVFSPWGVMSLEPYKTVAMLGDSITTGYNDFNQDQGQAWWTRAFWPANIPCACIGRVGETAQSFAALTTRTQRWPLIANTATYAIVNYGRNDFTAARSAAQVQADLQTIFNALAAAGITVFAATILPKASSTDSFATLVNQTTDSSNADRVTVNTWLRTTPSPCAGFVELADSVESSTDSGLWKIGTYTVDGTHPQPTGVTAMAAAVNTSLFL